MAAQCPAAANEVAAASLPSRGEFRSPFDQRVRFSLVGIRPVGELGQTLPAASIAARNPFGYFIFAIATIRHGREDYYLTFRFSANPCRGWM